MYHADLTLFRTARRPYKSSVNCEESHFASGDLLRRGSVFTLMLERRSP
jgi:hypothetical protein